MLARFTSVQRWHEEGCDGTAEACIYPTTIRERRDVSPVADVRSARNSSPPGQPGGNRGVERSSRGALCSAPARGRPYGPTVQPRFVQQRRVENVVEEID